jgi:hypothetical protein
MNLLIVLCSLFFGLWPLVFELRYQFRSSKHSLPKTKDERPKAKDQRSKTRFSTASEEIFVEIQPQHFTNLLQVDT